jgi:uncharacterized protein (TIGR00730 family)
VKHGVRAAVCVYCGSSAGADPVYADAARELGRSLACEGFQLVYGGSSVGLMRCLADAALDAGGRVIGVRPNWLFKDEPPHSELSELHEVGSMHERKQLMFSLSDAFVILPGGLGTLDEFFEIVSWAQLGIHNKPIIAVDVHGFWAPLFDLISQAERSGFIARHDAGLIKRVGNCAEAMTMLTKTFSEMARL